MLSVISVFLFLASITTRILQEHNGAPLARPEGVGHADHVVPLGVAEVLRRQRGHGSCRAVVALAGQEGLVQFPQLFASLHDELVGRQLRRDGDLPRLDLAVVEPVRPRQDSAMERQAEAGRLFNSLFFPGIFR
jgi:hypothetical protein